MPTSKKKRQFARCPRSQFVFPFVEMDTADGTFVPMLRLKHASVIAAELHGHYDLESDSIVIPGEDTAYHAVVKKVNGRHTKFYPVGPQWDWQKTGDTRVYEAYWSKDFYNDGKYFVAEDFFSVERCYEPEEVQEVHALGVGGYWESHDYGSFHTATRVV